MGSSDRWPVTSSQSRASHKDEREEGRRKRKVSKIRGIWGRENWGLFKGVSERKNMGEDGGVVSERESCVGGRKKGLS